MKTIIIAEKPSVASSFSQALGGHRKDGFFENDSYIITYCIGHLYELAKPFDYNPDFKRFSFEHLPLIPDPFLYIENDYTIKQTRIVEKILRNNKNAKIIVATDADREGEIIARIVLEKAGIKDISSCYRFWVSQALTKDVILKGIQDAKPLHFYNNLSNQGFARQKADWLVGFNFTPFITLTSGNKELFSVGRVQTALLNAIVQRDLEIKNFIKTPYYQCVAFVSDGENDIKALLINPNTKKTQFSEINAYIKNAKDYSDSHKAISIKSEVKRKQTNPPLLLNLTELQKIASKQFSYSPDKTLEITQKLYEEYKCVSYPRTPSRVLGSTDFALYKQMFNTLKSTYNHISMYCDESLINEKNIHIFNDKKLDSHHALIPLDFLPAKASEQEKNIYELITTYFFLVAMKPFVYDEKEMYIHNGEFVYKSIIKSIVSLGWKEAVKESKKDEDEVYFNEQKAYLKKCEIEKKYTTPKKEFTETSLLAFMENPTGIQTDEKLVGLGTSATRADIIKKLLTVKYIEKKGKNIIATDKGFFLIDLLQKNDVLKQITEIQQTTYWEKKLFENPQEFENEIISYVTNAMNQKPVGNFSSVSTSESLGTCPVCGLSILEGKSNFYCTGYKSNTPCVFKIWKNFVGSTITKQDVQNLLSGKNTKLKELTKKDGKKFKAKLKLENNQITFVFENVKKKQN